jgi:hypothetical protein
MLIDRHRIAKLLELSELERRLTGPERLRREEDVALLVKAAYDDALEAARAEFMGRVQGLPASAWPWSAVAVGTSRPAKGRSAAAPLSPPALILIRRQADIVDADPGNVVHDRSAPDAAAWEPLHRALDTWDTSTIKRWIGPQGWVRPVTTGLMSGKAPRPSGGLAGPSPGIVPPGPGISPPNPGVSPPPDIPPASGLGTVTGGELDTAPPTWRRPAAIVAGATVVSTVGVVLYSVSRRRKSAALPPTPAAPSPVEEES